MQDFRPAGSYTIQGLAQTWTVCNTQIHQINNEKEHTHYFMILGFHTYNEYIYDNSSTTALAALATISTSKQPVVK